MKAWLQFNKLPPSVGLNPGPLGQQASAKPTELPELLQRSIRDAQAVRITSFSHMHLSGDVKDILS